jgi:tetratricopeptide (TPR) repeat protein
MPDYAEARRKWGRDVGVGISVAAFLGANAGSGRPIYLAFEMPPEGLPEGHVLSPAGALWKLGRWPEEPDLRHWAFAAGAEEVPARYRRWRGQRNAEIDHVDRIIPEPYERRLLQLMLQARRGLADWNHERGGWREAIGLYESIRALDPEAADGGLLFRLGDCRAASGDDEGAKRCLELALQAGLTGQTRASAIVRLAEIGRRRGDEAGVRTLLGDLEGPRALPDDVRERLGRLRGGR